MSGDDDAPAQNEAEVDWSDEVLAAKLVGIWRGYYSGTKGTTLERNPLASPLIHTSSPQVRLDSLDTSAHAEVPNLCKRYSLRVYAANLSVRCIANFMQQLLVLKLKRLQTSRTWGGGGRRGAT